MANYSKLTNFATKDALLTGDPLKVVKGTEIDDEFEALETSIATKADLAGPTFTGTPAAPTAASGTNSTQIATTAFVTDAVANVDLESLYPVGSIYMNAADSTNPATLIGFGTWTAFGAGRVPVGIDSGDTDFDTAEATGGAKTHTLTTDEIPAHTHNTGGYAAMVGNGSEFTEGEHYDSGGTNGWATSSTGGGDAHNNLQPYIVVYMWKRTA
jgi:hypothetical protein